MLQTKEAIFINAYFILQWHLFKRKSRYNTLLAENLWQIGHKPPNPPKVFSHQCFVLCSTFDQNVPYLVVCIPTYVQNTCMVSPSNYKLLDNNITYYQVCVGNYNALTLQSFITIFVKENSCLLLINLYGFFIFVNII